jgi:hypothetical protein
MIVTLSAVLVLLAAVNVQPQDFDTDRHTIDAGGLMFSSGGDYELSGTIGQPDAGILSGGEFTLTGGFWFALAPGDFNNDGGVNLLDYADFQPCLSGPGVAVTEACVGFDVNRSGTVDLLDFAVAQTTFTGL